MQYKVPEWKSDRSRRGYSLGRRTTSRYETGAFNASASSCAFSLTLPLRSRKFLIASLTLLLGRWVYAPGMRPFSRTIGLDFRAGHLYLSAVACVGVISTGLAT
jgi:hypothetical protein